MRLRHLVGFLLLSLAACGDDSDSDGSPGSGTPTTGNAQPLLGPEEHLPGVYVLDVSLSTPEPTDKEGNPLPADKVARVREAVQAREMDALRITLNADGTFELALGEGEHALTTRGTWGRDGPTVTIRTTSVNGEEMELPPDPPLKIAKGRLVMEIEGRPSAYLKKIK